MEPISREEVIRVRAEKLERFRQANIDAEKVLEELRAARGELMGEYEMMSLENEFLADQNEVLANERDRAILQRDIFKAKYEMVELQGQKDQLRAEEATLRAKIAEMAASSEEIDLKKLSEIASKIDEIYGKQAKIQEEFVAKQDKLQELEGKVLSEDFSIGDINSEGLIEKKAVDERAGAKKLIIDDEEKPEEEKNEEKVETAEVTEESETDISGGPADFEVPFFLRRRPDVKEEEISVTESDKKEIEDAEVTEDDKTEESKGKHAKKRDAKEDDEPKKPEEDEREETHSEEHKEPAGGSSLDMDEDEEPDKENEDVRYPAKVGPIRGFFLKIVRWVVNHTKPDGFVNKMFTGFQDGLEAGATPVAALPKSSAAKEKEEARKAKRSRTEEVTEKGVAETIVEEKEAEEVKVAEEPLSEEPEKEKNDADEMLYKEEIEEDMRWIDDARRADKTKNPQTKFLGQYIALVRRNLNADGISKENEEEATKQVEELGIPQPFKMNYKNLVIFKAREAMLRAAEKREIPITEPRGIFGRKDGRRYFDVIYADLAKRLETEEKTNEASRKAAEAKESGETKEAKGTSADEKTEAEGR